MGTVGRFLSSLPLLDRALVDKAFCAGRQRIFEEKPKSIFSRIVMSRHALATSHLSLLLSTCCSTSQYLSRKNILQKRQLFPVLEKACVGSGNSEKNGSLEVHMPTMPLPMKFGQVGLWHWAKPPVEANWVQVLQ